MATKWACLGAGRISWDFFMSVRENLPEAEHEFVAIASRDIAKAQTYAKEFGFRKVYGSYDDVAKDEEVEVVYIGTISRNHVQLSIQMLEAGKHVLCEKPMAMSLEGARRVFETARRAKRIFTEGFWSMFSPAYCQIRKELAAGTLGEIRLVQASMCFKAKPIPETGGGGVLDLGCYPLLLACMVFSELPESIQAAGVMTEHKEMDIGGSIILKYKNGGVASLAYHEDVVNGATTAHIMGSKGTIEIPDYICFPTKLSTPSGTYEYHLKNGTYSYPNSAGLHYEATAMRDTIISGKLENEVHTMAASEMISTIAEEVRRQIGVVSPGPD